jgi:soluble lytic murein transglycosylase-like protein
MEEALTVPAELAISERVQQLQTLITDAREVAAGRTPSAVAAEGASASQNASTGSFASVLAAAEDGTSTDALPSDALPENALESSSAAQYEPLIDAAAERNGVEPALLHGLIEQESGFDATAQSSAGASGLTQLMPSTAASMGVADPLNAPESIEGGARYLGELMREFGGNTNDALAAYNAGPGAVEQYGGVPPYAETQNYVSRVLANASTYSAAHPDALAEVPA